MLVLVAPAFGQTSGAAEPAPGGADTADYFFQLDQQLDQVKVVSASQQLEPLSETPGPVTVVTREMIQSIGARTLQDVLLAYVPGFTLSEDQNELNVAVHGVYGSAQQKVLILLDGHRLNSRAYSTADPDYGISLDEIKQIEVLRGPGSSLYGNVALMAVVNLVTLEGKELNGARARVGVGNYGQRTVGMTFGKSLGDREDLLVWGSAFESKGEPRFVPAGQDYASAPKDGYALLNAINGPPSYDVGAKLKMGNFELLLDTSQGSYVEPLSAGGVTGETYDSTKLRTLLAVGPGLNSRSDHIELGWNKDLSQHFNLDVRAYFDRNDLSGVLSSNPAANAGLFLGWKEASEGGVIQGRQAYSLARVGEGNATFGVQVDRMQLLDSVLATQAGGDFTKIADTSAAPVLQRGAETIFSGFAQVKQHLGSKLILNMGLRYDLKERHQGDDVSDLSPRLAAIFAPSDTVDVKLSYAQSFVDAPYWYRYNSLPYYRGAVGLTPEHLRSVQLTPSAKFLGGKVLETLNLFYNDAYNLVYRNNAAAADQPIYQNSGRLRSVGAEEELVVTRELWRVHANATYQSLLDGVNYGTVGHEIFNVPQLTANLIVDFTPLRRLSDWVWLDVAIHFDSSQASPVAIAFPNGVSYQDPGLRIPSRTLFNATVHFPKVFVKGLGLDLTAYNLFDTRYEQGGSVVHPYPRAGRWFLANLSYQFDPLAP